MATKTEKMLTTDAQQSAYKNAQKELKVYLRKMAQDTVRGAVDKKTMFSYLGTLKSLPLAMMKQNLLRQGWDEQLHDTLYPKNKRAVRYPVSRLLVKTVAAVAVVGMALGAMAGFAVTGGTALLAVPIAGGIVGGLMAIGTAYFGVNHRKELAASFKKGEALAQASKPVKKLKKEVQIAQKRELLLAKKKVEVDEEIDKEIDNDAAKDSEKPEKEVAELHKEVEDKIEKKKTKANFTEREDARKKSSEEKSGTIAA